MKSLLSVSLRGWSVNKEKEQGTVGVFTKKTQKTQGTVGE